MNRIFSTTWSEALGQLVVVSELAGSRGQKGRTRRRRRLVLNAAGAVVLFGMVGLTLPSVTQAKSSNPSNLTVVSGQFNSAPDPASAGSGCRQPSPNGGTPGNNRNYSCADAIAVGSGAHAEGGSTVVGSEASSNGTLNTVIGPFAGTDDSDANVAIGNMAYAAKGYALALGRQATSTEEFAIALGNNATASNKGSIALGNNAYAEGVRSIAIGSSDSLDWDDATNSSNPPAHAEGNGAIAMGSGSDAKGISSVAIGEKAATGNMGSASVAIGMQAYAQLSTVAIGGNAGQGNQGMVNVFLGSDAGAGSDGGLNFYGGSFAGNGVEGSMNVAVGTSAGRNMEGDRVVAVGITALKGSSGVENIGIGNAAGLGSVGDDNVTIGLNAGQYLSGDRNIALGYQAGQFATGASSVSRSVGIGSQAMVWSDDGVAIGTEAAAGDKGGAPGTDAVAIGHMATASASSATAIGYGAQAMAKSAISVGTGSVVSGAGSGAFGDPNKVSGAGSYAIGNGNTVGANNAFVLGSNVTNNVDGSVVLGSNSAVAAAVGTASTIINGTTYNFAGASPVSTVSVGAAGQERTITNVAAGRISDSSTDAINGSQLYATNQAIGKAAAAATTEVQAGTNIAGITPSTDATDGHTIYTVNADGASVSAGSTDVTVTPATPDANNVTDYAVDLSQDTKDKIDGAMQSFTTVADGAVAQTIKNGDQANFTSGDNIKLTASSSGIEIATTPNVSFDQVTINNGGPVISNTGIDMGGNKITHVGAGTDPSDAVNVSQLQDAVATNKTPYFSVMSVGQEDNFDNTGATGEDALAAGTSTTAAGDGATAVGNYSAASGQWSTSMGNNSVASGDFSVATGNQATASGLEAAAFGAGATASGDYSLASGNFAAANKKYSVAVGTDTVADGARSVAMGNTAQASADDAVAMGSHATASGAQASAFGVLAEASGIGALAIGNRTTAAGDTSIVIGYNSQVTGDNSGAFGDPNTVTGTGSYAFGNNNNIDADNAFVLGNNITNNVDGSVVLGNDSTVAAAVGTTSETIGGTTYNFAGSSPVSTVSVGAAGKERTVTNVAAGRISSTSTDAVNGSQLYATNQAIDTVGSAAGKPITFTGDDGSVNRKLGQVLKIQGGGNSSTGFSDGNIRVRAQGGDTLDIQMSNSPRFGNLVVNQNGAGTINNLTNRTWDPDTYVHGQAATEDQLHELYQKVKNELVNQGGGSGEKDPWTVADANGGSAVIGNHGKVTFAGDNNLDVTVSGRRDDANVVVSMKDNIHVKQVTAGNTVINNNGMTVNDGTHKTVYGSDGMRIENGPSVTSNGVDAGGKRVTNVADGQDPTDAVNVQQLNQALQGLNGLTSERLNALDDKIGRVGERANAGVASAIAMANLPQAYSPGQSSAAVSFGSFYGESALALGFSAVTENGRYVFKGGVTTNSASAFGFGVGAAIVW